MPRLPRIVIPNCPHHVTQRGNRKQQTFFDKEDYLAYKELMGQSCKRYHVKIMSYCLMPNHVHMIAIPSTEISLSLAIGEAHEHYTKQTNYRMGWRGHLWQGRYFSVPMDEEYTEKCIQYIEMNPVRANLCARPEDYEWSSARSYLTGCEDTLLSDCVRNPFDSTSASKKKLTEDELSFIRRHSRTGRPLGKYSFVRNLEKLTGLPLAPQKRGPKLKLVEDHRI